MFGRTETPWAHHYKARFRNGLIEGRELTASYSVFGNQTGVVFLGIPHVEKPLGELRFRKAVAYTSKWEGVLETKEMKPACMSDPVETYKRPEGGPTSEDCLYINVLTSHYCLEHKNCSVMVAVHGGQMIKESPATYQNDIIVNNFVGQGRNVVVVTVPYRLGVFGLPNVPGDLRGIVERNLILHDVVAALEWTKREVANFGGLANKTTLFGHSGGATILTILAFHPEYDHLFQQRIVMSMPLLMHSELANYQIFAKVAKRVGCNIDFSDVVNVFDCLRNVSAEELFEAQDRVFHTEEEYFSDFAIDGEILPDNPRTLLKQGNYSRKPMMIGTVPYELMYTGYTLGENGGVNMTELEAMCQMFAFLGTYEKPYGFRDKCMEYYGKKEAAPFLLDHVIFHIPTVKLAKHHAVDQPVYLYKYTYSGAGPAYNDYVPGARSPIHSEDFLYYMGVHRTRNFTEKDMSIEGILTGMVADFVNYGEPKPPGNLKWEKMDSDRMNYFHIDFDEHFAMPGMKSGFYTEEFEFWTEDVPRQVLLETLWRLIH
ncbi:unnamed protein product [Caenorhabditis sp. 36 PRJEB53466]|nr:unnamed protein product [Caenorhabditis sp. 36 PRJEB53466]